MHTPTPNPSRRSRIRSRWCRLVLLGGIVGLSTGCRAITRSPYDLIEAELRTRERELGEARSQLRNTKQPVPESVLVECATLTDAGDRRAALSSRWRLALCHVLSHGIAETLGRKTH